MLVIEAIRPGVSVLTTSNLQRFVSTTFNMTGARLSKKRRKSRQHEAGSPRSWQHPVQRCPAPYCWDCKACVDVETFSGCASLWCESHGVSVLDSLIEAERVMRTGVWHWDDDDYASQYKRLPRAV